MRIVFPDPLVWQSGLEFGLQALGELHREGAAFEVTLLDQGPMLEAAAFAVTQYAMQGQVRWVQRWPRSFAKFEVAVFPRVVAMHTGALTQCLEHGVAVISSDPAFRSENASFHRFARRDCASLADLLKNMMMPATHAV